MVNAGSGSDSDDDSDDSGDDDGSDGGDDDGGDSGSVDEAGGTASSEDDGAGSESGSDADGAHEDKDDPDSAEALTATYSLLSVAELKMVLEHNSQIKSGRKAELVERVVEAVRYGCFPRCPRCHAAVLKADGDGGDLKCPGHYDAEDGYQHCGFRCEDGDLDRPKWKDLM